ncbi:MAG: hypothetical protein HYU59_05615 [Magnetospirillum gryphiswaldense]|nr:hypothetical protein [Magnetospirillum gryphiswaldense]
MPVEIKIWHEDAAQTLAELRVLAGGFAATYTGPLTSGSVADSQAAAEPTIATAAATSTTVAEEPAKRKRRAKAETPETARTEAGAQAGTSETTEDAAQDDADEQAESDIEKKELTRDDVRAVLGKYVQKFGMDAAQEDGPKVIALMFGEGKSKVSDIPEDQDALAKAVAGVEEMLAKNPYNRGAVNG